MRPAPDPDVLAARLAARRHGLITLSQCQGVGLSASQVKRRVARGRWELAGRSVYRIVGAPQTTHQMALAAVASAGERAVASHLTALALVGVGSAPALPHVTVPRTGSARMHGMVVHRSNVDAVDRTTVGCIPATSPARSLVDAAALVGERRLAELVDSVVCAGLAQPSAILGAIRRSQVGPGRKGVPQLREVLRPWFDGIRPGSPAEVRLLRRLGDWGFPSPVSQHLVRDRHGHVVAAIDLGWPTRRIGLEYDGEQAHAPRHLGKDVEREERIRALGWSIERVDRTDLRPGSIRLRDLLGSLFQVHAA